tara:strand:+ start:4024 stop:4332 length:309 start_codon:yes stop_codon:yes gene_type:complete
MQWWNTTIIIYTALIWQIALVVWLIMRYYIKNRPPMWVQTNMGEQGKQLVDQAPSIQSVGVVEVQAEKKIFVDSVDDMNVKMDEEKTGKVKTQKDKLRNLIK